METLKRKKNSIETRSKELCWTHVEVESANKCWNLTESSAKLILFAIEGYKQLQSFQCD